MLFVGVVSGLWTFLMVTAVLWRREAILFHWVNFDILEFLPLLASFGLTTVGLTSEMNKRSGSLIERSLPELNLLWFEGHQKERHLQRLLRFCL